MNELALALSLGLASGFFLTLMDRFDEHRIIERHRTATAYLAGIAAAGCMAWSIELFPIIYPLLFALLFIWIIKGKIDFPSHVFFLFLLTLFMGYHIELLQAYWHYILIITALNYLSGTVLRRRLGGGGRIMRWYYASYFEKLACYIILAMILDSLVFLLYGIGFTVSSLYTKLWLPGTDEQHRC